MSEAQLPEHGKLQLDFIINIFFLEYFKMRTYFKELGNCMYSIWRRYPNKKNEIAYFQVEERFLDCCKTCFSQKCQRTQKIAEFLITQLVFVAKEIVFFNEIIFLPLRCLHKLYIDCEGQAVLENIFVGGRIHGERKRLS